MINKGGKMEPCENEKCDRWCIDKTDGYANKCCEFTTDDLPSVCRFFLTTKKEPVTDAPVQNRVRCDDCMDMTIATLDDIGEHHHRMCPKYRTEKFPHLFYYEDAVNAWVPAPNKIEEIISASDQLENGEIIEIQFKRCDMTDEEIDSLPIE